MALIFAGIGVTALPNATAAEATDAVLLRGSDVVVLPSSPFSVKTGTAKRELQQGLAVDDTCRFSLSLHAEKGDTVPKMVTVIAVDPNTCKAEIERGDATTLPAIDDIQGTVRPVISQRAADSDVGAEGQNKNRKATYWTVWSDPAEISVATTRTSVRSFVKKKKIDRAECRLHLDQLHQTGWQIDKAYKDFDCNWSEKQASAVADAHYFNDDFLGPICSGRDRTHVYVSRNKAIVTLKESDGNVLYTWAKGGCSSLLSVSSFLEIAFYNN